MADKQQQQQQQQQQLCSNFCLSQEFAAESV
jgi:hypothetical protein